MDTGLKGFLRNITLASAWVSSIKSVAADAFVLSFERTHPFLPGQVVAVTTDRNIPPRLYSVCSGADEGEISILFNIKPDGLLTPKLARLLPGDQLFVSAPFGAFLGDNKPAWWIAAGTGIAPYRAMMRSGLGAQNWLIHGSRRLANFYFDDEMVSFFGDRYVRCCSQEKADGVVHGRLTAWLAGQTRFPPVQYYLCGSAEMVVEVRDILIRGGVNLNSIMSEIYF
ncbi:MAG: FAD-dependent oxidoreductase [Bacteroidales bacterium]|nr:FAD-dependent oxidoreductase [Bacteroidales bacterium]